VWQKWSFPLSSVSGDHHGRAWCAVEKTRRITAFDPSSGTFMAAVPERQEASCRVELTDIRIRHGLWWTLGFEASGPRDALPDTLATAAVRVLHDTFAGDTALGLADSTSYAEWLERWEDGSKP
jgi:hypothetical protein